MKVPKNWDEFKAPGFIWITRVELPHSLLLNANIFIRVVFPHPGGPINATGVIGGKYPYGSGDNIRGCERC